MAPWASGSASESRSHPAKAARGAINDDKDHISHAIYLNDGRVRQVEGDFSSWEDIDLGFASVKR